MYIHTHTPCCWYPSWSVSACVQCASAPPPLQTSPLSASPSPPPTSPLGLPQQQVLAFPVVEKSHQCLAHAEVISGPLNVRGIGHWNCTSHNTDHTKQNADIREGPQNQFVCAKYTTHWSGSHSMKHEVWSSETAETAQQPRRHNVCVSVLCSWP